MCGIGGKIVKSDAHPVGPEPLRRMLERLRHRGPDDLQIWTDGRCGLCHARLAVLDPSPRGRQPMVGRDGRFLIVYNGEVYNFRELRRELVNRGEPFSTGTDTEVILRCFERDGIRCADRFEGMFAFAVYDREQGELHLFRDRLGIKPLFYVWDGNGLCFASEPKALPRDSGLGTPDPERIAEYFAFRNVAGEECLLPEVRTLPPGHRLRTDGRQLEVAAWHDGTFDGASDASTGEIVAAAVRRQLVSDVPVGVFLSGGCDSALVCDAAARALPRIDAFTVGFADPEWDESERARRIAERTNATWHRVELDSASYDRLLDETIWHLDAPLNHAHTPHLLVLSTAARREITVALTGEGADEMFAGYPRYRLHRLARLVSRLPGPLSRLAERSLAHRSTRWRRLFTEADADPAEAAVQNAAFVPIDDAARLAGLSQPERILDRRRALYEEAVRGGRGHLEALLEVESATYLVSLLQRMDRMSMAAGLECRVPLLDERVVAHARALPIEKRLGLFDTKKPIRATAAARFSRAFAHAPKSGFGVPVRDWLRDDTRIGSRLQGILSDRRTVERGWFDVQLARCWLEEHRQGVADRSEALWGILNLEVWARVCLEGEAPSIAASGSVLSDGPFSALSGSAESA